MTMALKFRKVKRPRRRKNPDAAVKTMLVSGGVMIAAVLFIRYMMNRPAGVPKAPKKALPPVAKAPLDLSRPDASQLAGVEFSHLAGGIFAGGWGN
jgi:hypothetical protein